MKKFEWSVCDYDYTKTYPDIDYSERVTESGLVLSMREIYNRYAAMGMDLLNGDIELDDDDPDKTDIPEFDDDLDVLERSKSIKSSVTAVPRKKPASKPQGKQRNDDSPLSPKSAAAPQAQPGDDGSNKPEKSETK